MVEHARRIAQQLIVDRQLGPDSLVVEIASNDGYLLQWYQQQHVPVLGIEPARNIAAIAQREKGVRTISEFFGQNVAQQLHQDGYSADIIHANNVLAHVAELNGVVSGMKSLLKPQGRVVVEAPYLKDLIDHVEFDTIYHEHLCYFSLTALCNLFDRHGLQIVDVQRLGIHGGSLRIFVAHQGAAETSPAVVELLKQESDWVFDQQYHQSFASRVLALRESLTSKLRQLKDNGATIAVYGASAKGSTLMNYFGIDSSLIDYVVDRSTIKQGRYTPGTHLEICDPQRLTDDQPDYCLLLTWNFADEILRQQQQYRDQGGKFIIPIPDVLVA